MAEDVYKNYLRDEATDQLYAEIRDDIPESFWKLAFWRDPAGDLQFGKLDVADRRKVILMVIDAVRRRDENKPWNFNEIAMPEVK